MTNTLRRKETQTYIVLMAISLTLSYMVYTRFLSDFNFGMSMVIFGLLNLVLLEYAYLPVQRLMFDLLKLPYEEKDEDMIILEALKNNGPKLVLNGLIGAISFCCMLPFLSSIDNAFLFILFGSIGRLIQVPLAVRFLKDQIEKLFYYYLGLVISILGTIFYQTIGMEQLGFSGDLLGYLCATVHLIALSCNSIIFKMVTSEEHAKERYVPVKTASFIIVSIETVVGGTAAIIILFINGSSYASLIPTGSEFIALCLIGIVVPLCGTLANKLVNLLSHAIVRAADGIRIVLGLIIAIIFAAMGGDLDVVMINGQEKIIGVIIILIGVFISFQGRPQPTVKELRTKKSK